MAVDPLLGEIMMFAGNFAPRGWAFCDGQLLAIAQNEALFALLGTIYGGDGRSSFGLPDLRGRAPIHAGNGPGLSSYRIGQRGGAETTTLTSAHLPSHSHALRGSTKEAIQAHPLEAALPTGPTNSRGRTTPLYATHQANEPPTENMHTASIGNTGGSQPFNNIMPYLTVNFCIALQGTFPSRS